MTPLHDSSQVNADSSVELITGVDAVSFLDAMGIPVDAIRGSVLNAHREAMQKSSPYYPRTAKGLTRWMETVKGIRSTLCEYNPETWVSEDSHGRPVLRNTQSGFELGIIGANADTGSESKDAMPQVARQKGTATQHAVNQAAQGRLFEIAVETGPDTWFLLYHAGRDSIGCELSRPLDMKDGFFTGWTTRVLIEIEQVDMDVNFTEDTEDVTFRIM